MGRKLRRVSKNASRRLIKTIDRHAVKNWRYAHKFWSVWLGIMSSIIGGLWAAIPAFQFVLPPVKFALTCVCISLAALVLRMVRQSNLDDD